MPKSTTTAKITLDQRQVLEIIQKVNPRIKGLKGRVVRGYDDPYRSSPDTFEVDVEVDVDFFSLGIAFNAERQGDLQASAISPDRDKEPCRCPFCPDQEKP